MPTPDMNREQLAAAIKDCLEQGGYLVLRFGHAQMRQLRVQETDIVLAALCERPEAGASETETWNAAINAAAEFCHEKGCGYSVNANCILALRLEPQRRSRVVPYCTKHGLVPPEHRCAAFSNGPDQVIDQDMLPTEDGLRNAALDSSKKED